MNRSATAISILTVLLNRKSETRMLGASSSKFRAWRQTSLDILAKEFGKENAYYSEFDSVQFQIEPELLKRAKHAGRRIVHSKGNLTRIAPSLKLEPAVSHQFHQAVERAAEVLFAARLELSKRAELE